MSKRRDARQELTRSERRELDALRVEVSNALQGIIGPNTTYVNGRLRFYGSEQVVRRIVDELNAVDINAEASSQGACVNGTPRSIGYCALLS